MGWTQAGFGQDSGGYTSINAKQVAFGQEVVVTAGYQCCTAMQCGPTVTTALTHQLPFLGALLRAVFARAIEQRTQCCAHVMTLNAPQIQVG